jgi:hypothetical protein
MYVCSSDRSSVVQKSGTAKCGNEFLMKIQWASTIGAAHGRSVRAVGNGA